MTIYMYRYYEKLLIIVGILTVYFMHNVNMIQSV